MARVLLVCQGDVAQQLLAARVLGVGHLDASVGCLLDGSAAGLAGELPGRFAGADFVAGLVDEVAAVVSLVVVDAYLQRLSF